VIDLRDGRLIGAIRERLRKAISDQSDVIVAGSIGDFPKYRELCGVVRGLRMALDTIADVVRIENGQSEAGAIEKEDEDE
jgi:hypothetical protein